MYSTCQAIWKVLQPAVMPIPDENRWKDVAKNFNNKWNFPNLLGAIHGKHIIKQAPPNSGSNYFCYKKAFSVVSIIYY